MGLKQMQLFFTNCFFIYIRSINGFKFKYLAGVLSSKGVNTTLQVKPSENNFTNGDKTKLDGIEANANNYSLPTASSSTLGGIKVGTNLSIDGDGVLSSTDTNTTYTVGDGGLTQNNFTDALKSKLDGIRRQVRIIILYQLLLHLH